MRKDALAIPFPFASNCEFFFYAKGNVCANSYKGYWFSFVVVAPQNPVSAARKPHPCRRRNRTPVSFSTGCGEVFGTPFGPRLPLSLPTSAPVVAFVGGSFGERDFRHWRGRREACVYTKRRKELGRIRYAHGFAEGNTPKKRASFSLRVSELWPVKRL